MLSQEGSYTKWLFSAAKFIEHNRLDSAEYALKQAMRIAPASNNNKVLLMLGNIQAQLLHTTDAYITYSAALTKASDSTSILFLRANLLNDMERYDEAIEDYNTILSKNKNNEQALYWRGLLYLQQKNEVAANTDFQSLQKINPKSEYALLSQALQMKLKDNWQEAALTYSKLIAQNTSGKYFLHRAECYLNSGQTSKAAADLHNVNSSEKQNALFYFLRAQIRLHQFDKLAAQYDFEKAKSMGYAPDIIEEWMRRCK